MRLRPIKGSIEPLDHCLAVKVARARRALRREEQGANLRFECRQRGSSHCESSWCETPSIEGISGSRAPSNGKLPRSMCHRGARDRPRLRARAETPPIGGICGGPGWQYGGDRSHRQIDLIGKCVSDLPLYPERTAGQPTSGVIWVPRLFRKFSEFRPARAAGLSDRQRARG